MTFSILALDRQTGAIGCAAATGNLAVGAWVLRAAARVGAVATQGLCVSPLWGDQALARLESGERAEAVVDGLTAADPGREHRQLAVLDFHGGGAVWTGDANTDVKAHIIGTDCVIAGNWLSGRGVLTAMEQSYRQDVDSGEGGFGHRLLAALEAGIAAGSDARGTLSAAIRIVRADRSPLDLRVDYDKAPLDRLRALYEMATNPPYSEWTRQVPTLDDPYRC